MIIMTARDSVDNFIKQKKLIVTIDDNGDSHDNHDNGDRCDNS